MYLPFKAQAPLSRDIRNYQVMAMKICPMMAKNAASASFSGSADTSSARPLASDGKEVVGTSKDQAETPRSLPGQPGRHAGNRLHFRRPALTPGHGQDRASQWQHVTDALPADLALLVKRESKRELEPRRLSVMLAPR